MTIRTREQAATSAEQQRTNKVGMCQQWTRGLYNAPAVGDRDGDGDADAVDAIKAEPVHHTDRNPPRGVPVAFTGGSKGHGHRAISLGGGKIRSTDMTAAGYTPGLVGTTTIDAIERSMGVKYHSWSPTISGIPIPNPQAAKPAAPAKPKPKGKTRGAAVDRALDNIKLAQQRTKLRTRSAKLAKARRALETIAEVPK
jgi:hypothetical protein